MYAPQTNIRLLSTPLENDGANTLTWNNREQQTNYFIGKTVFHYPECTYQRKGGYIRIDRNIEDLYICNYIMYRNSAYTDKWFYAFITDMEYVNDGVTYVYIDPDEIQTWYFDVEFKDSFVVREHTNDDTIGSNQTDEGIGLGAYVTNKKEKMYTDKRNIVLLEPLNTDSSTGGLGYRLVTTSVDFVTVTNVPAFKEALSGGTVVITYNRSTLVTTFGGSIIDDTTPYGFSIHNENCRVGFDENATFEATTVDISAIIRYNNNVLGYVKKGAGFSAQGIGAMQTEFSKLINKSLMDDIGGFYLEPDIDGSSTLTPVTKQYKHFSVVNSLDNYVPKNNKLYIYPYTIIKVHNASDNSRIYQPELFADHNDMQFAYWSDKMPSCSVVAVPVNYAGASLGMEYAINSAKYPLSSRSYDVFKNYLGIHSAEYNIQVASNLRSGALSLASARLGAGQNVHTTTYGDVTKTTTNYKRSSRGKIDKTGFSVMNTPEHSVTSATNPSVMGRISGAVSGATQIASTLAEVNARQKEAYDTIGAISNNNLNASGDINIYIEQQTINSDYAKRVDDYFSMYGYKTNLLKIPNIKGRKNWNYVQTINANITADIPNDSLSTIRSLLDGGITFWHNPDTIYDYSQDNSII